MAIRFPLLRDNDRPFLPGPGEGCLMCGTSYQGGGFAYIGGGASYDVADCHGNEPPLGAFFNIGYHGKQTTDSGGVEIVKNLQGGQFDLQFCSIACLRQFFSAIVDEVEKSIGKEEPLPPGFLSTLLPYQEK